MKKVLFLLIVLMSFASISAQKYVSKDGHIWFLASTPLEEIEAHNHQAASILDVSTGDVTFSLLMKSFEFKRALMQEHFNENYVESDKFPKATFKGKINDLPSIDFKKDGVYKVNVTGDLTIHGVTKNFTTPGTIEIKGGQIIAKSVFIVTPKEFDIKIPSLVENKIAKEVTVNVDITYNPYTK